MGFLSDTYRRVQRLKPREIRSGGSGGDAVPLILGAFNPIAGAIAGAGRILRAGYERRLAEQDAERAGAGVPGPTPEPPPSAIPEPQSVPFTQYAGSGGGSSGGGIPVAFFTQLGRSVGQQTAAVRAMLAKASGARGGRTTQRRRRKQKKTAARRAPKRRTKGNKFKKGSAAAKAHMAKLRRMRKK